MIRVVVASALSVLGVLVPPAVATPPAVEDRFAITDVRVFDGHRVFPRATVVVERGEITAVGPRVSVPPGVAVIDGTGKTLLPGLIDGHAHAQDRASLERALFWGVTTELDMGNLPRFAEQMRREQRRNGAPYRADLYSSGFFTTVPGGYPYQLDPNAPWPTLASAEGAENWVEDRLREGSDYFKLTLEDWSWFNTELPILSREMVRAVVREARERGRMSVAHVTEQVHARTALEDGVDGLVHVFVDEPATASLLQLARQRRAFVVPTLSAIEWFVSNAGGQALAADPRVAPFLTPEELAYLVTSGPPSGIGPANVELSRTNTRLFYDAGIPLLVGTDQLAHGLMLHRDLELLVLAGVPPVEALRAATANAAQAFGLHDRGRITPGRRADLVLVNGDPTADITATRAIERVWKLGVETLHEVPVEPLHHHDHHEH